MKYLLSLMFLSLLSACATGERVLRRSTDSTEEQPKPALEWNWADPGAIIFTTIWVVVIGILLFILYKDFTKKSKISL